MWAVSTFCESCCYEFCVQVLAWTSVSNPFDVELLSHMIILFNLLRNFQSVFLVTAPFYIPTSNEWGFQFLSSFANTCYFPLKKKNYGHPNECEVGSHGGFDLHSLMTNNAEHLFMCLLCLCFSEKRPLSLFKLSCLFFRMKFWIVNSESLTLIRYMICKYFLSFFWVFFQLTILSVLLHVSKVWSFSLLSGFLFYGYVIHCLSTYLWMMDIYIVSSFLAVTIKLYEYSFASFNVDVSLVFLGKYLSQW